MIILIRIKPFKKKLRNTIKIASESVFLLSMLLFAGYVTFEDLLGITNIKILGWVISILFMVNLFLELVSALFSLRSKKKGSKSKKVQPEIKKTKVKDKKKS